MKRIISLLATGVLGFVLIVDMVHAFVGDPPPLPPACKFSGALVTGSREGWRQYQLVATCQGYSGDFYGKGAYDPATKRAQEDITNGQWRLRTSANCDFDPWATNVTCTGSTYNASGNLPDGQLPNLAGLMAPVSARVNGFPRADVQTKLSYLPAYPPSPPSSSSTIASPDLPPRNVTSVINDQGDRVTIFWLPPADQSEGHKTVIWYEVERRPIGGPRWSYTVARHPAEVTRAIDYRPIVQTEYRVCAGNQGGKNCSDAVTAKRSITGPAREAKVPPKPSPLLSQRELKAPIPAKPVRNDALVAGVTERLKRDVPAIQPRVQVSAANGVVTLTGTVQTIGDKSAVENSVKNTEGVTAVQNNLQVATVATSIPRDLTRPGGTLKNLAPPPK